tara:strand:- start:432 stop:1376 length:945 start_codon:yes stop_codon:yes gene_type:complete
MATVNLGKIKLKWRGSWQSNASPAYSIDDVVEHTDGSVTSSYIAVAASSNQAPSTGGTVNTTYWNLLAKGQAVSPTTTQGDIIVRGASADTRLAIGSAGQGLKVNSSGNGLEYGNPSIVERVYHWVDDTQVVPPNTTSGSSTGSNVFTYTITAKTANPIYRLDWSFFWGLNDTNGDSNEIMAIAGVFTHASNTGLSNLAYGFGFKGGSRANATFRGQTNTYCLFDSDAGAPGTSGHWSGAMQNVMAFGNTAAVDTGTIGKCGDDSTQTVAAGQTLYLRGWVGNGNMGSYGRTENQTNHMTKAQIILTEFNSSGQ